MSEHHSAAYVRSAMLPEQAPPVSEIGVIRWLRENLFSGPLNTFLTLAGSFILYFLVKEYYPWLRHSVWQAGSVGECRDIVTATWGEGATGACWAIIRDRWNMFMFGFYPREHYWRPTLALGLLIFAAAPVLFAESRSIRMVVLAIVAAFLLVAFPGLGVGALANLMLAAALAAMLVVAWSRPWGLLWLTGIYPGLAVWMLWGGSVWGPVLAMSGFVLGWAAWLATRRFGTILSVGAAVLVPVAWWLFGVEQVLPLFDAVLPYSIDAVRSEKFGGFVLALTIGVAGIVLSLPIGVVLALARRSDMLLVKALAVGFIEFIRGVPLISLLFVASLLLNYFLPPGTNFDIILRVIIMVTLFAAAYIAEVVRGGLAALPRGQFEAADSLGLDYWKAQRLIVLPQALKISIPGIVSTFIGMFKDTTLVVFVGLLDPLKGITDSVRASFEWKGAYWEPYIFVGCIFFIFNFSMSRYSMYLERRLKRDHR
ncbi:amino acid ABC transporter permease [Phaeovulum sp.]|uniref:amino acid ABC transporter permease n=1 Tax=Phaeovulum sp. TaxID=2934796 RepID=UPI002730F54C|nr:amino acid ABC transporter permease [Phaeovulum sp.]MDP1668738.1 amino acid ABC transporter permease [Phaeovulum sp.]MDZ4120554.1 amino acid ABC transporter permease [Phaeovulum sp.]